MQGNSYLHFCNVIPLPLQNLPAMAHENEIKQNRYKTELCRSFEELNTCKYGKYCKFAHTRLELNHVMQHPNYKTKQCEKYHVHGYCPYGVRCKFIH